jgi:hypothetical protein
MEGGALGCVGESAHDCLVVLPHVNSEVGRRSVGFEESPSLVVHKESSTLQELNQVHRAGDILNHNGQKQSQVADGLTGMAPGVTSASHAELTGARSAQLCSSTSAVGHEECRRLTVPFGNISQSSDVRSGHVWKAQHVTPS